MARTPEQVAQTVNALVDEVNALKADRATALTTINAIITAAATNIAAVAAVTPLTAPTAKGITQQYRA